MINIELIPAFTDNYIFALTLNNGQIAVIDPGDAAPVLSYLKGNDLELAYILLTHHHDDHIGGTEELRAAFPDALIIGHEKDEQRLPALGEAVNDGDKFTIGDTDFDVIETAGHTIGHICYHLPLEQTLFVGDTLFVMGCGRLFEGSAAQMYASLEKISALDDDTQIYCAHEYSLANAAFALHAFPDNDEIKSALFFVEALREDGIPTVPTTLKAEKLSNPFLLAQDVDEFAKLRSEKDSF
jgi:hydroxyacylglutathione hydrolase